VQSTPVEPFSELKALAEQQHHSPDTKAQSLPPPPGIEAADIAPLKAEESGPESPAVLPLEKVLDRFKEAEAAPQRETHEPSEQALRLYVSGRAKLLDGQASKAVNDLEAATRLDPTAAEPWRELGQAQLELGRRTSAMSSFQKAVKLGLDEPRLLALLARDSIKSKRFEDAAKLLVQARQSPSLRDEAGLSQLADIDLAESLGALGYVTASRDLLAQGLQSPFDGLGQSRVRAELSEVLRRRGELWQRIGDSSCRLGQYAKAAAAYANAAQVPTLDPGAAIARQVYADLRLGHSADAAMVVINDIRESEGRVEDRHMGVIRFLAKNTDVGPKLADAIDDISRAAGPSATPTVLNRLARASAAALTGDQARNVLRSRLAKSPYDTDLVADLLGTHEPADVKGRLSECTRLVQSTPLAVDTYAQMLLIKGQGIDASMQILAGERAPASRLLEAALLTRLSRPDRALQRLDGFEWPSDMLPAALAMRTTAAVANGNWDAARTAEQQLESLQGPQALRARVAALQAMQQFDKALEILTPSLSDNTGSVEDLLVGADLALRCERASDAEQFLTAAITRDRFDERGYEGLISLYVPSGPLPDETKLTNTARSLRLAVASSRVIRGINAQELVARSLWSQSEPQLLSILVEGNENPSVLNLLVTTWEHAATSAPDLTAHGEQWLRARLQDRPESTALLIALSRVLVAEGKAAEADSLLASRLAVWPIQDLARQREWVVREGLEKPDEADMLARARLQQAPKTIDNTIELAELLVHSGDVTEADQRLRGLPDNVKLTAEQAARLVAILPKLKPEQLVKSNATAADSALHLFDLIAGRGGAKAMPPEMHLTRLTLLATGHPDETDRLIAAIDQTAARYPELVGQAYQQVAEALQKKADAGPLLKFLGAASNHVNPPNEALLSAWYELTAERGDAADVERLINDVRDPERAGVLLAALLRGSPEEGDIPDDPVERHSDIARRLGDRLSVLSRDALAETAYRACLKIYPDNAWAANNLGYQILDSGGNIDEAEHLIERAYKSLGDEASIIDSMGWVMYKRGQLEDSKDEGGNTVKEGAVSLLKRALAGTEAQPDPTVMDHAADAYWRTGDKDKAKELWLKADGLFSQRVALMGNNRDPSLAAERKKAQAQLTAVRDKRTAAEQGREPTVAPLAKKDSSPDGGEKALSPQDRP
jgi:tetratricopeptide (TPR) repeat protein